jgi:hypothetical protein
MAPSQNRRGATRAKAGRSPTTARTASTSTAQTAVIVDTDYRGYRIEVIAQHVDNAWNAEVRIRRTLTEDKPHVEVITCRKPTATVAEERGMIYARRWVDRHGAG